MKTLVKVGLGMLAGGLLGFGAACLGKKHNDDEDYVTTEVEIEDNDSDSDEEAE